MTLILASGSQRRRELMTMCGYDYEVKISNVDEALDERNPKDFALRLAKIKATDVYNRCFEEYGKDEELVVVGADTIIAYNGEIIGKPNDKFEAKRILKTLSGNSHTVCTGLAVVSSKGTQSKLCESTVKVAKMTEEEIDAYIASGEPMDKAGAYGIQGAFGMFVESISGDYYTVVGLPLATLYKMLKDIGITPSLNRIK